MDIDYNPNFKGNITSEDKEVFMNMSLFIFLFVVITAYVLKRSTYNRLITRAGLSKTKRFSFAHNYVNRIRKLSKEIIRLLCRL